MARWLRKLFVGIAKFVGGVLILVVVIFGAYLAWAAWEAWQVRSFCAAVKPGTPISSLPEIASAHGVNRRYVKSQGHFVQTEGRWFLFVPIAATIGESGCKITHDGKFVLSARM